MSSYKIQQGLFQFDFTDCYAILGVSLNTEATEIRKRYLKVVYHLHPDTCKAKTNADKEKANLLLSKLVNPAYEELQKDRVRAEHQLIFPQIGKRITQERKELSVTSEVAKSLVTVTTNVLEMTYEKLLAELVENEYKDIQQAMARIAQISELNLVYLQKKYGENIEPNKKKNINRDTFIQPTIPAKSNQGTKAKASPTENYTRRAKQYIEDGEFAKATLELREGLKLNTNDSTCHALLGWAYIKQKQYKMAQIHIRKALEANPHEELAQKIKVALDKQIEVKSGKKSAPASDSPKQSGGILGGFFKSKKKK